MSQPRSQAARDRVLELAADARYRPFVIGYLLSCLDERHWEALADAAVQFAEGNVERQRAALERLGGVPGGRG